MNNFSDTRKREIIQSKRLKTARVEYYWYAGILVRRIAMCFDALDIYLWHELLYPMGRMYL